MVLTFYYTLDFNPNHQATLFSIEAAQALASVDSDLGLWVFLFVQVMQVTGRLQVVDVVNLYAPAAVASLLALWPRLFYRL